MWNLTSRPRAISPHHWTKHSIGVYKDVDNPIIIMPDKLSEDTEIGVLRARAVVPAVSISNAPKPPKKRFLEAAAALQLEEQRLQQQQRDKAGDEDNSALMQLAEMCVYYQTANSGNPSGSWSPVAGAWKYVNPQSESEEDSNNPTIYSISMTSTVKSESSPKAATPFWGWVNRPFIHAEQELCTRDDEMENEEPLDLSGEETIRTNQQELIDHLVEKLCARPVSGKFSSLVQKKLSLLEPVSNTEVGPELNSSSEVSSSIDSKNLITTAAKDVRRDLPLKKRDSPALSSQMDEGLRTDFCDSSTATKPESPSADMVTSTNSSKKPAPRSCKGKRYLEFMYEGRISSGNRNKKMESNEQQEDQTTAYGQSSNGSRKRQRLIKHADSMCVKPNFSLRGRHNKMRKLS